MITTQSGAMRLTVIGCSGSFAGPDAAASCYLLEAEDGEARTWRILLDLGSGSLGPLQRFADAEQVDGVFFSHLHPDHCLDLCGMYVLRRYHPDGALPRIPVWGPSGVADRMARAYDLPDPGMTEEFDFHEYDDGSTADAVRLGPFLVEPHPVEHPVPAYGFRVTAGGRTLAYTGDTGMCPALDDLATGADLLLVEASFRHGDDNPARLHLTGREAGEIAARNGVPRVVLTHVPPWFQMGDMMAEAAEVYDGHLNAAAPGATYRV